ncbi:MAG: 6-carboxytetrahydropterin synthase [Candidatus Omnitrophota bacterium]
MFEISVRLSFSGAHRLRGYRGKCENIHGHNWDIEAFVAAGKLNNQGISMDFKFLRNKLKTILSALDHCDLNEISFFKSNNPSAENIAKYIYENLKRSIRSKDVSLTRISVWETRDSRADYFERDKE